MTKHKRMTLNNNVNDTGGVVAVSVSSSVVNVSGTEWKLRGWSVGLGHADWRVGIVREQRLIPRDRHRDVIVRSAPSKRRRWPTPVDARRLRICQHSYAV